MSRAGTPTDNAAMEAINGWIKAEIFNDFHLTSNENISLCSNRYESVYVKLNINHRRSTKYNEN